MGEVLEMKRKVRVSVNRFGHVFSVEYRAGRTPQSSDPQAALQVDGRLLAWLEIGYHESAWSEIHLDLSDDHILVTPAMLGIVNATDDLTDHRFLSEAEEYVMGLLNEALAKKLAEPFEETEETEEDDEGDEPLSPMERGMRVLTVWHNHGRDEEQLPELVAIEVYSALEEASGAIAIALDTSQEEVPREQCGNLIRELMASTLEAWHEGAETEEEES
jgi:hypothetical protein